MKTHLIFAAVIAAALAGAGCNRAETDQRAADVRDVAARAGDHLADSWLTTKIQAQYFADQDIKARYIHVSTRDGAVTLSGRVDDQGARMQAIQIANNTDGVKHVTDQLIVGAAPTAADIAARTDAAWNPLVVREPAASDPVATSGAPPPDDALITSSVQAKYYLDNSIKGRRIDVDTRRGVVTLRGEVASDGERAQALLLARTTQGVDRVEDGLTVKATLEQPQASAPESPAPAAQSQDMTLTSGIQDRFAADAQVQAGAIEVTTKDGVVLLDGTAPTAAAKQRALTLARETPGVIQVVDRISVTRRTR